MKTEVSFPLMVALMTPSDPQLTNIVAISTKGLLQHGQRDGYFEKHPQASCRTQFAPCLVLIL